MVLRIFHLYTDVTFSDEGLNKKALVRYLYSLSRQRYLLCHTRYDVGPWCTQSHTSHRRVLPEAWDTEHLFLSESPRDFFYHKNTPLNNGAMLNFYMGILLRFLNDIKQYHFNILLNKPISVHPRQNLVVKTGSDISND